MASACHLLTSGATQSIPVIPASQKFDLGVEVQLFSSASCTGTAKKFDFFKGFMSDTSGKDKFAYWADTTTEQVNLILDPGAGTAFVSNVEINNNEVGTNSLSASITFDSLPTIAADICFSEVNNGATCSPWINSTVSPQSFNITAGDGVKNVYMFARSVDLTVFPVGQDSILLDTTAPVVGAATAYNAFYPSGTVNLNWSFTDLSSLTYNLKICPDISCSTSCAIIGSNLSTSNFNWTISGVDGPKFVCVNATDIFGNTSAYSSTGSFDYDSNPPTAISLNVNASATYTTSLNLTYTVSASGADFLCINENNTTTGCTWNAYTASGAYTLSSGEGNRNVYAFFKDNAGNISTTSTSIIVDTGIPTPPGAATLSSYYTSAPIAVNWGASVDANLARYNFKVCADSACSTSCGTVSSTVGTVSSDNIQLVNGIQEGTNYLCINAEDLAGNISSFTSTGSFIYDTVAPIAGTFQLKNSDPYTNNTTVSWQTSGEIGSPSLMCVNNVNSSGGCSWVSVASSGTHTLTAGDGNKTAYLFYKDAAGNISTGVSDSITLDTIAPAALSIAIPVGNIEIEDKTVNVQFSGGADTNFSNYNVKLCDNNLCNSVVHASEDTGSINFSITKPSTWALNEVNYVMVKAVDMAGNVTTAVTGSITKKIKKRVKDISIGTAHTCAVMSDGDVKCWGSNTSGQLGLGHTSNVGMSGGQMGDALLSSSIPVPVKKVSAGINYTCALTVNGLIYCWGSGTSGKLGLGSSTQQTTPQLVDIGTGVKAIDISARSSHTCAVTAAGEIKCWGQNINGELGIGSTTTIGDNAGEMGDNLASVNLDPIYKALKVSVGNVSTCALMTNHQIKCWGNYTHIGQNLGTGVVGASSPTDVNTLTPLDFSPELATDIQSGSDFHCALFASGKVKCWGENSKGQLGMGTANLNIYGTSTYQLTTVPFVSFGGTELVTKLVAGDQVACALLDDGTAKCWGDNISGVIGQGTTVSYYANPSSSAILNFGSGQYIRSLSISTDSGCAVLGDGHLKCWGLTAKLGMGTTGSGLTTVYGDHAGEMGDTLPRVDLGNAPRIDVMKLTVGAEHSCALLYNGRMKCWGSNAYGQIGLNLVGGYKGVSSSEMGQNLPYLDLGAPKFIKDVEGSGSGVHHTCALMINGALKCFGRNHSGQLGIGDTTGANDVIGDNANEVSSTMAGVNFSGDKIKAVATGPTHTCALTSAGTIWCFGENANGQLGINSNTSISSPTSIVATLPLAVQIAVGTDHSCAVLDDGQAKCWGGNIQGQLGINSTTGYGAFASSMTTLPFVSLGSSERVVKISAGLTSTCAILSDRKVKCWGRNHYGQLGMNDSTSAIYGTGSPYTLISQSIVNFETSSTLSIATEIEMGGESACVLKANGYMKCWGRNEVGQTGQNINTLLFGDGSTAINTLPDIFTGSNYTEQIKMGRNVCRINGLGQPLCWGDNSSGQVGQGTNYSNYGDAAINVPTTPIEL